ncbi:hypothetical protein I3842_Q125400 [Carya illinoinensis]|uniref:Uncharacterized protein n=1 Tax=Carya illinoinensis TaxID=32201 RepID=A0A922A1W0_CARIL|nr:hypothetical protein I3842_Q125400 [Carya illinoinensis]
MEELLSRKVSLVKEEAGETSRRRQSIEIDEEASSTSKMRKENLEKLKEAGANIKRNSAAKTTPKIQKVPALLRGHENFKKYFEPRVVSLGPIHHGNKEYQAAEDFKLGMASEFVEDSGESGEFLLEKIVGNIKQLKQYFDEKVAEKYDDETLAWMLFVDGCAVLQSIHTADKKDQMAFVQQDMLLLENQLPYRLLLDLMAYSKKKEKLEKSIENFMKQMAHKRGQEVGKAGETNGIHLLDLLHTRLVGKSTTTENKGSKSGGKQEPRQSYRNVQELRAAGIYVKPAQTSSLTKISFDRFLNFYPGYLRLPLITVDDSTAPKFFNLIAYEICSDFENNYGITSYVAFLESLIDHPGDVKELRNAGILHNLLVNFDKYKQVKTQIQEYFDKAWVRWVAEFFHQYFSSPWTVFAFLGALLALFLSATQTWYAVFSPPGPCDKFCEKFNQNLRKG